MWAHLIGLFMLLPYLILAYVLWPTARDKLRAGRAPLEEMPLPEYVSGLPSDWRSSSLVWMVLAVPYLLVADLCMNLRYFFAKPAGTEAMHYMALRRMVGAVGEADLELPLQFYILLRLMNPLGLFPALEPSPRYTTIRWLLAASIANAAYTVWEAYAFTTKFAALQTQDNRRVLWARMCALGRGLLPAALLFELEQQRAVVVSLDLSQLDAQGLSALCSVARRSRTLQSIIFLDCSFLLRLCASVVDRVHCGNALRDLILCPCLRHLELRGAQLPQDIIDSTVYPSLQKHPALRVIQVVTPENRMLEFRNAFADKLDMQPALLRAIWAEDLRATTHALKAGELPAMSEPTDHETAVHLAARRGTLPILRELLLADGGPSAAAVRDDFGQTALHLAAEHGHVTAAELLLVSGSAVNAVTKSGRTPLWRAAANGFEEVARLFVRWGANRNYADEEGGLTPVFIASQMGHRKVVEMLLAHDADIHRGEMTGATPLYVASYSGHGQVVRALLERDADVNRPRNSGATPLFVAAQNGHLPVVVALLQFKAEVDPRRRSGATPLFVASQDGHLAVVRALLSHRADVHQRLNDGASSLFVAAQNGHLAVVNSLLYCKASVHQARNDGATARHVASQNGYISVLQALKVTNNGETTPGSATRGVSSSSTAAGGTSGSTSGPTVTSPFGNSGTAPSSPVGGHTPPVAPFGHKVPFPLSSSGDGDTT
jgi:ankyrin repeat protein